MDTLEYATMRLKWETGLTVQDKAKIEFALDMVSRLIDRLLYVWYELYCYIYTCYIRIYETGTTVNHNKNEIISQLISFQ